MIAQLQHEHESDAKELALAIGGYAAVAWGIGVCLYAFSLGPQQIGWGEYASALVGGIATCLALPPLALMAHTWLLRLRPFGRH